MSLISAYRDVIIPDLQKMVEGVSDGGEKGYWTASRHSMAKLRRVV